MHRRRTNVLAACLVAALCAQAILSMRQKSVTVDEIMYIAAGYYHLRTGDFMLNATNPPLMKLLPGAALLALDPDLPALSGSPRDWSLIEQWQYARRFLYENRVDADRMLFAARLPVVALSALLGVLVFSFARRLYGDEAALLSLALYCFSPDILAHSRLATQDLGLAAAMFAFVYAFFAWAHRPSPPRLLLCGALFGLAILTKSAGAFVVPIAGIYALARIARADGIGIDPRLPGIARIDATRVRWRQAASYALAFACIGIVGIAVLNAGHAFQGSFAPLREGRDHPSLYARLPVDNAATRLLVDAVARAPVPLPGAYRAGIEFQSRLIRAARDVYFFGEIHEHPRWYMLPVAFAIKTPVPVLLLLLGALASMAISRRASDGEQILLALLAFVTAMFTTVGQVNIAVRYLLPVQPVAFVLAGRLLSGPGRPRPAMRIAVFSLAAWCAVGSLASYPHYLAYFNALVGGPTRGSRYLVGTNLDLGQDLKGLARYLDERGIDDVQLAYYGSADARYYGVDYRYLPSVGLAPRSPGEQWWYEMGDAARTVRPALGPGLVAVSANLRAGRFFPVAYEALRDRVPVAHVGHSILLFELDEAIPAGAGGNAPAASATAASSDSPSG